MERTETKIGCELLEALRRRVDVVAVRGLKARIRERVLQEAVPV